MALIARISTQKAHRRSSRTGRSIKLQSLHCDSEREASCLLRLLDRNRPRLEYSKDLLPPFPAPSYATGLHGIGIRILDFIF